jgi:CHASE3 domain sensor protein
MIEALMLSAIGLLQGYILTRIDALENRFDEMRDKLNTQEWHLKYLMAHQRTRKDDHDQGE